MGGWGGDSALLEGGCRWWNPGEVIVSTELQEIMRKHKQQRLFRIFLLTDAALPIYQFIINHKSTDLPPVSHKYHKHVKWRQIVMAATLAMQKHHMVND